MSFLAQLIHASFAMQEMKILGCESDSWLCRPMLKAFSRLYRMSFKTCCGHVTTRPRATEATERNLDEPGATRDTLLLV